MRGHSHFGRDDREDGADMVYDDTAAGIQLVKMWGRRSNIAQ